ncbi:MAG: hypothetical protein KAI83_14345 [Thiomargarita sp.]|nr:hypothetical protein [Thiomargarita sp.]
MNIEPVKEIKTLKRFSEGEIGRLEAMKTLNIDYSTLLDRVGQQGLSLPTLPFNELEHKANQFVHILKQKSMKRVVIVIPDAGPLISLGKAKNLEI